MRGNIGIQGQRNEALECRVRILKRPGEEFGNYSQKDRVTLETSEQFELVIAKL